MNFEQTPGTGTVGKTKGQDEVWRRDVTFGFGWPLDQTNGIITEILGQTGIIELFWFIETIKIKVIPV